MTKESKVYQFWNGKNIDGKSQIGSADLLAEKERNSQAEMKYEVGCDTISADDLQNDFKYE